MARPTDYNPEILARAKEYLLKYKDLEEVVPTIEGLAEYMDVSRARVYEWAKDDDKEEFRYTVESVQRLQSKAVLNGALLNTYNPSIAKLILSAKHGYVEKQDITSNGETVGVTIYLPQQK